MDFDLKSLLIGFNESLTFFLVFPGIILLGLYLTFQLRFVQVTKLKLSLKSLLQKDANSQGNISHYQAISSVLAGNFGTGNISGMAIALATGGPGALVWMWVMAFLGAAIQFASCVLGVKYRKVNAEGEFVGGPMYYLTEGIKSPWLGIGFAIFAIFASFTVGNFAQVNSVVLPLTSMGLNPFLCGIFLAVVVGFVLLGGIQRIASLASFIVPLKAILYLGTALLIIFWNADQVLPALKTMFYAAFNNDAMIGGVLGFGALKALTAGFDRGIFATDAGTGIVPMLQASARSNNPVIDGVATLIAPFLVMIVCTATGLVLMVTGAWEVVGLKSTNMVTYAFEQGLGHEAGRYVVIVALLLFAFTTILAWAFCGEKAVSYIWGIKAGRWFKYLYIALVPIGTVIHLELIWLLADISISLMLITNMIGIAALSREVIVDSRKYFGKEIDVVEST